MARNSCVFVGIVHRYMHYTYAAEIVSFLGRVSREDTCAAREHLAPTLPLIIEPQNLKKIVITSIVSYYVGPYCKRQLC